MYSRRLPSTLKLRFSIDAFLQQIEISPEEVRKYEVTIDSKTLEFSCNDDDFTVEYEEFHPDVLEEMKNYIQMLDHEKNNENEMLQKTFTYFRKII
jgi:hypothetical protein